MLRLPAGARKVNERLFEPFRALESAGGIGCRRLGHALGEGWRHGPCGNFALNESQPCDRGAPEIGIDSPAEGAAFVLQEHGRAGFRFEGQDSAGRPFAQAHRPREARNLWAHNFNPAQDERWIAKAGSLERRGGDGAKAALDRFGPIASRGLGRVRFFGWTLRHAGSLCFLTSMPNARRATQRSASPAARLLTWYDSYRRELPWRARGGEKADPYRVWLSEIMLQQTTGVAVASYYREFLARWPTVEALAAAPLDDVLAAWAGLGYYARARNLHRTAQTVATEHRGKFPRTAERQLPGIGPYTAGAIAAIAFDAREAAVDANAERVLARFFAVEKPLPIAKPKLRTLGQSLVPEKRAGDFAQALMDLGATICTSRRPSCANCPWAEDCVGRARGVAENLPIKAERAARPLRRGAAFVARDAKGAVLLVKRPEKGLLGGMLQPPLGPWAESFPTTETARVQAPFDAEWRKRAGIVRHGFTHFELEVEVYFAKLAKRPKVDGNWVPQDELRTSALPTVMRKILAHALDDGGPLFAGTAD